jgi:hypothetical protein
VLQFPVAPRCRRTAFPLASLLFLVCGDSAMAEPFAIEARIHDQSTNSSGAPENWEFRVANVVFGSICRRDEQGRRMSDAIDVHAMGDICEENQIPVRGKGSCMYAGERVSCTWYGFEFDYESKDPDQPITCTLTRLVPTDLGNVDEVVARRVTTSTFELEMGAGATGRHRHPMYTVFRPFPGAWQVDQMTLSCTYLEEEVIATRWSLVFSSAFR